MKKVLIFFAGLMMCLTLASNPVLAQEIEWIKTFPSSWRNFAYSAQQTRDGGYIVAGTETFTTGSLTPWGGVGGGNDTFWLLKTDPEGNIEWDRTFAGSTRGRQGDAYSVQQTSDGGYILAGYIRLFGSALGNNDARFIKTNFVGDIEWDRTFGGEKGDEVYSVQQTSDGGYILAGRTRSFGSGSSDAWLIKIDSEGNMEWDRTFGGSKWEWEEVHSVQQTSDGGYVLAGHTQSLRNRTGNRTDAWLIKTDPQGNKEWDRTFGGSGWEEFYSVQQTSDGGYVLAGHTQPYIVGRRPNVWLLKTDSEGNKEWDRTFGPYKFRSVQQTRDGGYIIVGCIPSSRSEFDAFDAWIVKTNSEGDIEWDKVFGGEENNFACFVQQTRDGGYIIAGHTVSLGYDKVNAWLIKLGKEIQRD